MHVSYLPRLVPGLANGGKDSVELAEKLPQYSSLSCSRLDPKEAFPGLNPQTSARAMVATSEFTVSERQKEQLVSRITPKIRREGLGRR